MTTLRTKGLLLRPHELADAEKMNLWENDPVLRRLSDGSTEKGPPEPIKTTQAFIKKAISSPPIDIVRMAICARGSGIIGYCMIAFIDRKNRSCKVGITIGERSNWGKGYGRGALGLVLKHCFLKLRMNRIGAEIYSFNRRSIALFRRAGFRKEGTLRQAVFADGKFYDEHIYGLLHGEWEKRAHINFASLESLD